ASASGRAIVERRPVFVEDAHDFGFAGARHLARAMGYRSQLMIPMLRGDTPVGVLALVWQERHPLPSEQLPVLQAFADQAVIAIENARLVRALQESNESLAAAHAEVSETLERQTATSEILRVISASPTDVQPVFEALAAHAARLCSAADVIILRRDG